jgi:hypothetical protein
VRDIDNWNDDGSSGEGAWEESERERSDNDDDDDAAASLAPSPHLLLDLLDALPRQT